MLRTSPATISAATRRLFSAARMAATNSDTPPRTVLITGVSKGLGKALAIELSNRGHTVIGCSRSQPNLDSLRSLHLSDPKHLLLNADVSSDASVRDLVATITGKEKEKDLALIPDIVVNNAGAINANNKIWEVTAEEFDAVVDTNVKGVANVLRHVIPAMMAGGKKRGVIVNMSSGWGRSGAAMVAPYCASKWAVEGLTKSVAKEVPEGMAVVALNPGVINTDMLASCFGATAEMYQSPESWAGKAATVILALSAADNVGYYRKCDRFLFWGRRSLGPGKPPPSSSRSPPLITFSTGFLRKSYWLCLPICGFK